MKIFLFTALSSSLMMKKRGMSLTQKITSKNTQRKRQDYVDKQKFYDAYCQYAEKRNKALSEGKTKPPIPNYLGDCVLKICTHLAFRPNFIGYPFRDEMISDALENIFQYFDNFDPNKSNQIFSYFTQIAYYAFLRRIASEKKQLYIKHKVLENSAIFDALATQQEVDDHAVELKTEMTSDYMQHFVQDYEDKMVKAKAKKEPVGLENFVESDDDSTNSTSETGYSRVGLNNV